MRTYEINAPLPPSSSTVRNHASSCPMEATYCENKCGTKVPRRGMGKHRSQDCPKRAVPCPHCHAQVVYDTFQSHQGKCAKVPLACPNGCGGTGIPREDMDRHLGSKCPNSPSLCLFKDAGCRFKGARMTVEEHEELCYRDHLTLLMGLVVKQGQQIHALTNALRHLSTNHTGNLMWKITEVSSKMKEARSKSGLELCSAPFYTSPFGYKLSASVFLNGNGAGEGGYVSVYIKILPGDYDNLLRWPFSHTVAFTLYDQDPAPERACNVVESFVPDPSWKNFQAPSKDTDSLGFGFPKFVPHEALHKRNYIKDDTIFVRVKVEPAKVIAV